MQVKTDGLVIREWNVGESDRLVSVLTRDEGVIRAFARQAKRLRSAKASSTQLLCYSHLSLYKGRDAYIIDEAQPVELFFGLRKDIERLSLAQYFCELAGTLAPEEMEAGDFLRLMLNALHFLSKGTRSPLLLKSVVEMRMMSLAGYMPDLVCCAGCSCYEADEMFFLPKGGKLYCGECLPSGSGPWLRLDRGVLTALRHTIYADFEKLFSFQLPEPGLKQLGKASESYVLSQLERNFTTLDFYRSCARYEVPKTGTEDVETGEQHGESQD